MMMITTTMMIPRTELEAEELEALEEALEAADMEKPKQKSRATARARSCQAREQASDLRKTIEKLRRGERSKEYMTNSKMVEHIENVLRQDE